MARNVPSDWKDDPTIEGNERLLRRIPKTWVRLNRDGTLKITSAAFKDRELSVNIESLMVQDGRNAKDSLRGYSGYGLASINSGVAREHHQAVIRQPTEEEPAHGIVFGNKPRSVARKMRNCAELIVKPQVLYID